MRQTRSSAPERRFQRIFHESPLGLAVIDLEGRILEANETLARMLGRATADLAGQRAPDLPGPTGSAAGFEARLRRADGSLFWARITSSLIRDDDGRPELGLLTIEDVTARRTVREQLRKLASAVEQSPRSVVITDTDGRIEYVNRQFVEHTGYEPGEVIGRTPAMLKSGYMSPGQMRALWDTIGSGREWQGEFYNRRKDGRLYWEAMSVRPIRGKDGSISHYLGFGEDVTVRKKNEQRLIRQANYDDLTQLPNRGLAADRLGQALARAGRTGRYVAVIFIDLDDFKLVNDSLGHAAGDELLREAAGRFTRATRSTDTVARLGGDEFVILLPDLADQAIAERLVRRVSDAFDGPFTIHGRELFVTMSCGVTLYPQHGVDASTLLRNADAAMYRAKAEGRATFRFFHPEMSERPPQIGPAAPTCAR